MRRGDVAAAIAEFQKACKAEPRSPAARFALGCAWLAAGETIRATDLLSPIAAAPGPYRSRAAGQLVEAERLNAMQRSPPQYVRHLFDQFSSDYDRVMVEDLGYRAHLILRHLADLLIGAAPESLDILDLGCGTGLTGAAFKALARRLDGVDLSPRIIGQAERKKIYDELAVDDVETFLAAKRRHYELLVAGDTLVYFGDLLKLFRGAARRLKSRGWFLFTVEKHDGETYRLGPKRRYGHSPQYLTHTAGAAGFECMGLIDCTPRFDAGEAIPGLAVALRRLS